MIAVAYNANGNLCFSFPSLSTLLVAVFVERRSRRVITLSTLVGKQSNGLSAQGLFVKPDFSLHRTVGGFSLGATRNVPDTIRSSKSLLSHPTFFRSHLGEFREPHRLDHAQPRGQQAGR